MPRAFLFVAAFFTYVATATADVDYALEQSAIKKAVANVADSVVQIRTVGGFERVGETQMSQGPTTGLIVTSDGYIVSSAFNFAQRPSSILVSLPSGKQLPAELVARDLNRMLVLLKVETDDELHVPTPVPQREIAVGQTAIALGRSFQTDKADTSLGIISGTNRMHGRVIQTDSSVSPANYGGPLVDIRGRVFGVLVPMSPQAAGGDGFENEVAGTEFYDSGIGFAVPLEHVFKILDRWKRGKDLVPGKLGVSLKRGSAITETPTVVAVWPGSPAAKAGWKANDTIIAVNGEPAATQNKLQFLTKRLYAGDKLTISLRRGSDVKAEEFDSEVELVAELAPYRASFLGVLPAAPAINDKQDGLAVGGVWPDSPAAAAGIKKGDSLVKLGETVTSDFSSALSALQSLQPRDDVQATIKRGEEELTVTATLAEQPERILSAEDLGLAPIGESAELRELEKLKLPQYPQESKYLAPADTKSATGLVIWLAANDAEEQAMARLWQPFSDRDGLAIMFARPGDEAGWQFEDLEYLDQLSRGAQAKFNAPREQTIVIGSGKAGQLAYALGLRRRETFGGVVADNAPLPRTMKVPENSATQLVNLLTITPRKSALAPLVKHDVEQLRAAGYPVSLADRPEIKTAEDQLDSETIDTIARWIAGLRRL